MTSTINNQQVYVQRLTSPQVTGIGATPSISPSAGSLGYNSTDSSLYFGNGTTWNKVDNNSSISGSTITDSTISFPTTGGTPATLNFYENYFGQHTWSGIWPSPITVDVTYIRLGSLIIASFASANAVASGAGIVVSDVIPTRFRPSQTGIDQSSHVIYGVSNGAGLNPIIQYDNINFRWIVYENAIKAYTASNWAGTGQSGILASTICYWI
jgi:hypothetical protein